MKKFYKAILMSLIFISTLQADFKEKDYYEIVYVEGCLNSIKGKSSNILICIDTWQCLNNKHSKYILRDIDKESKTSIEFFGKVNIFNDSYCKETYLDYWVKENK